MINVKTFKGVLKGLLRLWYEQEIGQHACTAASYSVFAQVNNVVFYVDNQTNKHQHDFVNMPLNLSKVLLFTVN